MERLVFHWNARYNARLIVPIEHNFGMAFSKSINTTWHNTHWYRARVVTAGRSSY